MIKEILTKCLNHETLSEQESEQMMLEMMTGHLKESQVASLLTLMSFRGESVEEITGFARAMRRLSTKLPNRVEGTIDTCGTGGDGLNTFNVSTATAIVLASMNIPVAKHGNRSVSSKSGSADVLELLGIDIQATADSAATSLKQKALCFLFAPNYHQSMRHVANVRKEISFRTIFNILGPLTNPAEARYQLLGVYDEATAIKMGRALIQLGSEHSLLVTGADGLDECAIHGDTHVVEVSGKELITYRFSPEDVGLATGNLSDIQVNTPQESAKLIMDVFNGTAPNAASDIVALNAGAAMYARNDVKTIAEGVHHTKKAIESKQTLRYLELLTQSNRGRKHA
ncbi:anthranilate phosphoribosyltransferase [Bacillus sp. JCM 19041]|uniref:anthranilate phosphoribosyltransferase n=1 Tax=Bacillus sp. JCM 19041 TaxID=1460637 RepID=UPI0006D298A0